MGMDWAKLRQMTARRATAAREPAPVVTQVLADFTDVLDDHHKRHDGQWLTVTGTENRVGLRYVCRCNRGYPVWVDEANVRGTRQVPDPGLLPAGHRRACDKGLFD